MCERVKFAGSAQLNARVMAAKFLSALCFTTIDSNFSFGRLQHRHSRTMRNQEGDRNTRKNTSTMRAKEIEKLVFSAAAIENKVTLFACCSTHVCET